MKDEHQASGGPPGLSRLSFLKATLGVVSAGAGMVLLPRVSADAAPAKTTCCKGTAARGCVTCPGTAIRYRCTSDCSGPYCICHLDVGQCFSFDC